MKRIFCSPTPKIAVRMQFYRPIRRPKSHGERVLGSTCDCRPTFSPNLSPSAANATEKWGKADKRLLSAVDNADTEKLSSVLKGSVVPTKLDAKGRSPFHLAASRGLTDCLDLMLAHGVDLDARDFEGCTALHVAVKTSQLDCVRSLLKHDVPVKATDFHGRTALHCAAISGCVSSASLLCDHGATIDALDSGSQTPLMLAARFGRAEICRLLIDHGAAIDSTDSKRRTALILACESDCPEVAEVLLSAGADVRVTDASGHDALRYAQQSRSERLRCLMRVDDNSSATAHLHTDAAEQRGKNLCQEPADRSESSTPETASEVGPTGLQAEVATEQELSAIGSRHDDEQEAALELRRDLARKISECDSLAEEYEGMKRQLNLRLNAILRAVAGPGSIEEDENRAADLTEIDLRMDRLEQQLEALRENLEREKEEKRQLQEQVGRNGLERAETGGWRADTHGDLERLIEERDGLAEEKNLAERRFTELEGHLDNMRALMSQYRTRKCSQSRQIEELEIQVLDLTGNNIELTSLVKHLQEELKSKGNGNVGGDPSKALNDRCETFIPGQLAELVEQCRMLQTAKESIAQQNESLQKDVDTLRARLQTDFIPLEIHDEITASWKAAILDLKGTIRETEHGYVDLQMETEQLRGENRKLREQSRAAELGQATHEEESARPRDTTAELKGALRDAKRELEAENARAKASLEKAHSEISSLRIQEGEVVPSGRTVSDLQSKPLERQQTSEPNRDEYPRVRTEQNRDSSQDTSQASQGKTSEEMEMVALRDELLKVQEEMEELLEELERASTACKASRQEVLDLKEKSASQRKMNEERLAIAAEELETSKEKCIELEQTIGELREEVEGYAESCFEKEELIREMRSNIERLEHEKENFQLQSECAEQRLKDAERHHERVISTYRAHLLRAAQGVMDEEVYLVLMGIWKMQQGLFSWTKEVDTEMQSGRKYREGQNHGHCWTSIPCQSQYAIQSRKHHSPAELCSPRLIVNIIENLHLLQISKLWYTFYKITGEAPARILEEGGRGLGEGTALASQQPGTRVSPHPTVPPPPNASSAKVPKWGTRAQASPQALKHQSHSGHKQQQQEEQQASGRVGERQRKRETLGKEKMYFLGIVLLHTGIQLEEDGLHNFTKPQFKYQTLQTQSPHKTRAGEFFQFVLRVIANTAAAQRASIRHLAVFLLFGEVRPRS
ncbi:ankyrin repeat domain-containing protein 35-like [Heterodontus francisci]|uniref:ankyrin repeat domain-containing protein 35-like n=1 Tax=Heterodontus francisci TaxID=7792 RepID=UPI00355C7E0C